MNRILALALMAFFVTGVAHGQQKGKEKKEEVTITKKGSADEKMTIVIEGDKVTINGKAVTDYDGDNIIIHRRDLEESLAPLRGMSPHVRVIAPNMDFDFDEEFRFEFKEEMREAKEEMKRAQKELSRVQYEMSRDRKPLAILGVSTEKAAKGLKLTDVSEGSAAEKAGLKEGDVIVRFAGTAVSDPDAFRELVRARKPGEEVEIMYVKAGEKKEKLYALGQCFHHTPCLSSGTTCATPPSRPCMG
jgi:serine protease Do